MSKSRSKSSQSRSKPVPRKKQAKVKVKERGTALTIILIVIVLHGAIAGYLYYAYRNANSSIDFPTLITLMSIHFLMNVVAAVGIWYWKKWALYVFAASTILVVVVGLLAIGMLSVFTLVLPLVILGWVLRTKWDYFE